MLVLALQGDHSVQSIAGNGQQQVVPNSSGASKEVHISQTPFTLGRALDCNLILPQSEKVSRWHCYILELGGNILVKDGSLKPVPETGQVKPSATGTLVNDKPVLGSTFLQDGDTLKLGPWCFQVKIAKKYIPEDPEVLKEVAHAQSRQIPIADPKLKEKFSQIHELIHQLSTISGTEKALGTILAYAIEKIAAAQVAAILLKDREGKFDIRMAWRKNLGRIQKFYFSEALLKSLPPDQSFLLETRLKEKSDSQNLHGITSGLLLPLWGKGERLGIFYMDNRRSGDSFTEEDLYLASAITSLITLQLALERQFQLALIQENMARYFAPDVVEKIMGQSALGQPVGLEVQERNVTVMFLDIKGFTELCRTKTPREINWILNHYFETAARSIQAGGGHVNKFIGDAVMGIFGAQPDQLEASNPIHDAAQAVRAAFLFQKTWKEESLNKKMPQLQVRIGINSGPAVVGNIGYAARMEYSVLGDVVNLASRIEKLATPNDIAVSEATKKLLEETFRFEDLGEQEVKGAGKIRIFRPTVPSGHSA
ncbi:MAG: FHA domain-containing protein [Elusimicrobia bacterium]|nr:FHA domain-containing protein [Elusimicrobiota bacterium]